MNERILELAEQARIDGVAIHCYNPAFAEKFAELIIKKCISQIALIGVSNFQNEDISWTVDTAIAKIEEHFGGVK